MTIKRTENGYALGQWECIPTVLPSGRKITAGEARAAVCRINGLTQREAAVELHCRPGTVCDKWQSLYFKFGTSDVLVVISQMIDLGALRRLMAVLLIINAIVPHEVMRTVRTRPARGGVTKISRRGLNRIGGGLMLNDMLRQLDELTGAGDCYTAADVVPIAWVNKQATAQGVCVA